MNEVTYVKLSSLVGQIVRIEKIFPPKYKAWDDAEKKYVTSEVPKKGFQKRYNADTNRGRVEFSAGQIATMLEATVVDGRADINGVEFEIKSNGKTGMDIRYFFNLIEESVDQSIEEGADDPGW